MTAAASAIDSGIQNKIHGSGTTTLIISNEEMNDTMKIVKALEDSNLLLRGITKTIEDETKEQKGGFLGMLLGTLGASLLGNMLTGKGILRIGYRNKEKKGILRTGYGSKGSSINDFQIPPRPLPNFEIQKYYQNAPRFSGFCSRDNLPKKIKNGAHVINLDKFTDVETHCRCNTFGCFVQY